MNTTSYAVEWVIDDLISDKELLKHVPSFPKTRSYFREVYQTYEGEEIEAFAPIGGKSVSIKRHTFYGKRDEDCANPYKLIVERIYGLAVTRVIIRFVGHGYETVHYYEE